MWPLKHSKSFSIICPSDLFFEPTWPSLELDHDFVKDIILSKFEVDKAKNMASRDFTRFFYDLT